MNKIKEYLEDRKENKVVIIITENEDITNTKDYLIESYLNNDKIEGKKEMWLVNDVKYKHIDYIVDKLDMMIEEVVESESKDFLNVIIIPKSYKNNASFNVLEYIVEHNDNIILFDITE